MTSTEMKTLLGLRMEDPNENNFPATTKYSALNVAQRTVANFLDETYLTELEFKDVVTNAGNTALITLSGDGSLGSTNNKSTHKPIRNSIRNLQTVVDGTYRYAIHIPFEDVKKLENDYFSAEVENPVFWVFGNSVHHRPNTGVTQVVLYYLKSPASISDSQDCELNESLHDIVVDLAESELWRMDNQKNRSQAARDSAMDMIKMLNSRVEVEGPDELG